MHYRGRGGPTEQPPTQEKLAKDFETVVTKAFFVPPKKEEVVAAADQAGCERSIKIKLKIKKTYFENESNTILKIKDLAAKIK